MRLIDVDKLKKKLAKQNITDLEKVLEIIDSIPTDKTHREYESINKQSLIRIAEELKEVAEDTLNSLDSLAGWYPLQKESAEG